MRSTKEVTAWSTGRSESWTVWKSLRRWLARNGIRQITPCYWPGPQDRPAVCRGPRRAGPQAQPDETVIAAHVNRVKPRPPAAAPGGTEAVLLEHRDRIRHWLDED